MYRVLGAEDSLAYYVGPNIHGYWQGAREVHRRAKNWFAACAATSACRSGRARRFAAEPYHFGPEPPPMAAEVTAVFQSCVRDHCRGGDIKDMLNDEIAVSCGC